MTKINPYLDAADAANKYEALRDRRDAARSRETWCDACRAWVATASMAQHLRSDAHVDACRKADAWKM